MSNVASVLVLRTKKFNIMWISKGQRGERKDADQNIPWTFLTVLFNIGYILMEWNILSSTQSSELMNLPKALEIK